MPDAQPGHVPDVVVITGMSGSGRTQALHMLEDMGFYCIDNLPPSLIAQIADLVGINSGVGRHLAVACDLRSKGFAADFAPSLAALPDHELSYQTVFLDTTDEILVRRYDENRRRHPIQRAGESVSSAIARERSMLADVRASADLVIDTSVMRTQTLRTQLLAAFSDVPVRQHMEVRVFSFGFKHGMPDEADLLVDVRFLPNPFWEPELRTLTGNDRAVADYVLQRPETQRFLEAWQALLDSCMPGYVAEGKVQLSVAIGCTGGQHRSVVVANATAAYLEQRGYHVQLSHRDIALANVRPD